MTPDDIFKRHHVRYQGLSPEKSSRPTLILAHGFGCDQQIWTPVANLLAEEYPLVLFDHMGCGRSDISAYDPQRYNSLSAYAEDLVNLVQALNLDQPILVGHSVASVPSG